MEKMILGKIGQSLQRLDKKVVIKGWVAMQETIPSGSHTCEDNGDGTGNWVGSVKEYTDEEQEISRSVSYASPTTGSDRLFQSYQASIANEDEDEVVTAKKNAWLERRAEIQAEYPLSTDSLTTD